MAYYSLVASLPSLQIGDEPPFTTEEYVDNCAQWVTERETEILRKVLLQEPDIAPCPLCKTVYDLECQIRNAVARQRGQKLGIDFKEYLQPHDGFSGQIETFVADAMNQTDPVELEQYLDRGRWKLAEELVGQDPFGFEKVLAYGIQLKIVDRWNRMDVSAGKEKLEAVITANTEKEEKSDESDHPSDQTDFMEN
ncbi:hypothetical protein PDESU_02337 [Pontiella desulfatans]|uniref:DUF2764 domain-containing protein n=1 Tax=Pontiella desulfatans TaxID=2750659 RepID=A0A6C2U1C8_PONDE|nr:DUF2764 family protein [Pontiella desulfatans]VGO13780.1 hypothetical protein PDESU_02337 [Pontiella desulfatans]